MTAVLHRGRPANVPASVWSTRQVLSWAGVLAVAGVVCVVGWYVSAGEQTFGRQTTPLVVAMAALLVASAANISWLLAGRRSVGVRRQALLGQPPAGTGSRSTGANSGAGGSAHSTSTVLVAQDGLRRFHRADCPLAAGRGWPAASMPEHQAAGRLPCGVCRP